MTLGTLLRFRLSWSPAPRPAALPGPRSRRRAGCRAVLAGAVAWVALTGAMSAALDVFRPRWRDPEFYVRLDRLQRWQAESPDRPLVVAFGSSRTQMGLAPAAMGYPDRPGSPVVFNMGYRAGYTLGGWVQLMRTLDAGVKPAAVLFQISHLELMVPGSAEQQYAVWAPRFSPGDRERLAPYTRNPTVLPRLGFAARVNPWATYRAALESDLVPGWQTPFEAVDRVWCNADHYGFIPHPVAWLPPAARPASLARAREVLGHSRTEFTPTEFNGRVLGDVVARCRAEGVAVAFFWAPTSPAYQSWLSPGVHAGVASYDRRLAVELGVSVFPGPPEGVLAEEDFADGFHLLRHGAAKYSRWMADTHLTPWLRSQGIIDP